MFWTYLLLIILAGLGGGMLPLVFSRFRSGQVVYLLTFTGAFLFGITILHLLPEIFADLGESAGIYIVAGFFLQVFLQQWSHGLEHGHTHVAAPGAHVALSGLLLGLSIHAFMEGIPLGFRFHDKATLPALFLGILFHKLPEAFTLATVLLHQHSGKKKATVLVLVFAAMTPLAAVLARMAGSVVQGISELLLYIVAIVAGAFLHISTTIFFESGTRQHELNRGKTLSMIIGLLLALATRLFE
ncbi:ZIP family metal transporter [Compostibacter hankyongensis]|uniref:ZIP family metal transporter n=1 Tax=Compostibacter hankyongensis TaxID=1007089 RepID=A0ABP8FZ11_9BACT